jgi:hypothetical protein
MNLFSTDAEKPKSPKKNQLESAPVEAPRAQMVASDERLPFLKRARWANTKNITPAIRATTIPKNRPVTARKRKN